jgi:hypothetical protein
MKIEVKNVQYMAANSDETLCYSATVYIDGVKAGEASNRGCGGESEIHPHALIDKLNAYAKTLPPSVYEYEGREPITVEQDAGSIIDELVSDWLVRRDFNRMMAKPKIVYIKNNSIWEVNFVKGATKETVAKFLADPVKLASWKEKAKPEIVLNLLPANEAFAAFQKIVDPSKAKKNDRTDGDLPTPAP